VSVPLVLEWQLRTLRREDMAPEKQGKDFFDFVVGDTFNHKILC
jgi:hypothetical protein